LPEQGNKKHLQGKKMSLTITDPSNAGWNLNGKIQEKAKIVYGRLDPSYGLGIDLDPDMTPSEALQGIGLDWQIQKSEYRYGMFYERSNPNKIALSDPDGRDMGTVSKEWADSLVPFSSYVNSFREFCSENSLPLEKIGKLETINRSGELELRLFMVADLTGSGFSICGDDPNSGKLLIQHPFYYGAGHSVSNVAFRVVCSNGMLQKVRDRVQIIGHNSNATLNIQACLVAARDGWQAYKQRVNLLAQTTITGAESLVLLVQKYGIRQENKQLATDLLRRIEQEKISVVQLENLINSIDLTDESEILRTVHAMYTRGAFIGSNLVSSRETAWGLLNCVTEYYCHNRLEESKNLNRSINSLWNGQTQSSTQAFLNSISSFAHEKAKREKLKTSNVIQAVRAW
jgi:hypothetical protein